MQRHYYLLISFFLVHLGLLLSSLLLLRICQLILQLLYYIQVGICYLLVVVLYVIVLFKMLCSQVLNCCIFLVFDLLDHHLPLPLHFLPQEQHLMLILQLNLIGNPLILLPHLGCLLVLLAGQRIQVLSVTNFLFFLLDFESPNILLQLPLVDPILIFDILQCDLGFLLQFCQLVQILKY